MYSFSIDSREVLKGSALVYTFKDQMIAISIISMLLAYTGVITGYSIFIVHAWIC